MGKGGGARGGVSISTQKVKGRRWSELLSAVDQIIHELRSSVRSDQPRDLRSMLSLTYGVERPGPLQDRLYGRDAPVADCAVEGGAAAEVDDG